MRERAYAVIAAFLCGALAFWGLSHLVSPSSTDTSKPGLERLAAAIIQDRQSSRSMLDWAIVTLADDAGVPIDEQRRSAMIQLIVANPALTFGEIGSKYGTDYPEFELLDRRLSKLPQLPGETVAQGDVGQELTKTEGTASKSVDRIPETSE
jgi:hypothetical protein